MPLKTYGVQFAGLSIIVTALMFATVIPLAPPPAQAQDSQESAPTEHAQASVASCQNVTYGSINTVAEQDVSPEIPHFVVPPNGDGAVTVDIGLCVEGISDIDPVNNTFTLVLCHSE